MDPERLSSTVHAVITNDNNGKFSWSQADGLIHNYQAFFTTETIDAYHAWRFSKIAE